jgi:hypothetical protein
MRVRGVASAAMAEETWQTQERPILEAGREAGAEIVGSAIVVSAQVAMGL